MTVSDTQTFALVPAQAPAVAPPKPASRVSVNARFREVAALEMAAIRAREDQELETARALIDEVKARARADLATWQRLLEHVEATVPDVAPKAGRAPYAEPAEEPAVEVLDGVVVDVVFPGEPDLCEDPDGTLARITELHEEQDASEDGVVA